MSSQDANWEKRIEEIAAHTRPKIAVMGLGGAGSNIVSWIKEKGVAGATVYALNTDAAHLTLTKADRRILIGEKLTGGQGAGGYPEKGAEAMKESLPAVLKEIGTPNLVFIMTGMGGGTGTGSAWVLAEGLKDSGSLVVGVVTIPFGVERARFSKAKEGLERLRAACDTTVVVDNNKLLQLYGNMPIKEAFGIANELIGSFVKSVSEAISTPSLVNLDFADLKAVMERGGICAIGVGEADGERRAEIALKKALETPLLDTTGIKTSKGALVQVIGGEDMTLQEVNTAGDVVSQYLDRDAKMVWGAVVDPSYTGHMRVIVALSGVESTFLSPRPAQVVEQTTTPPPVPKKKGFLSF
jgi:cell division protein FtsZ